MVVPGLRVHNVPERESVEKVSRQHQERQRAKAPKRALKPTTTETLPTAKTTIAPINVHVGATAAFTEIVWARLFTSGDVYPAVATRKTVQSKILPITPSTPTTIFIGFFIFTSAIDRQICQGYVTIGAGCKDFAECSGRSGKLPPSQ